MPLQATTVVGNGDDADSLYFNPFASPTSSHTSFSSAFTPKEARSGGSKPTLRRRCSDGSARRGRTDHDPTQDESGPSSVHARSRTMDTVVGSSSGTNLRHPLAASTLSSVANSSRSSLTDTRPRLKRLLSDLGTKSATDGDDGEEQVSSPKSNAGPQEKVVIVHKACSHSIIGVNKSVNSLHNLPAGVV
jgi:hypothetical protein